MHPKQLEAERAMVLKRCRAGLDFGPDGQQTAEMNIVPHRDERGVKLGYDVFLVDTTRRSRARDAGTPMPLNDTPIPTLQDAQDWGHARAVGRAWFCWRGARAHRIDTVPQARANVLPISDIAPPWLKGKASAG